MVAIQSLKLPARFIADCDDSGCDVGDYRDGYLYATDEQIAELINRAEHYASPHGPDAIGDGGGLVRAAKALLKAIKRIRGDEN